MALAVDSSQALDRRRAQLAAQRERAFREAQRHSVHVRMLKVVFPILALGGLGLYGVPALATLAASRAGVTVGAVTLATGSLKMMHPRMEGVHPQHGRYDIRARSATQNVKSTDVVNLDQIDAQVVSPSKETTTLVAPTGVFRSKEERLLLEDGVVVTGTNGMSARLRRAEVSFRTHVVTTNEPVDLRFHESVITADSASIFASESRIVFTGHVRVHLENQAAASESGKSGARRTDGETERTSSVGGGQPDRRDGEAQGPQGRATNPGGGHEDDVQRF